MDYIKPKSVCTAKGKSLEGKRTHGMKEHMANLLSDKGLISKRNPYHTTAAGKKKQETLFIKMVKGGLPWESSGQDSALPMHGCRFNSWLGKKIPHFWGQKNTQNIKQKQYSIKTLKMVHIKKKIGQRIWIDISPKNILFYIFSSLSNFAMETSGWCQKWMA